jgi:hypothetical protein
VIGLEDAVLVWSELLELCLEQLGFLVCYGLLVEDEYVRNVIRVNLEESVIFAIRSCVQHTPFL